jgi:hypothetical protein
MYILYIPNTSKIPLGTSVWSKIIVFWDVKPCSMVDRCQSFSRIFLLLQDRRNHTDAGNVRLRASATRKPKWPRRGIKNNGHHKGRVNRRNYGPDYAERQKEIRRNRVTKQWPYKGLFFERKVNGRKDWAPTGADKEGRDEWKMKTVYRLHSDITYQETVIIRVNAVIASNLKYMWRFL